MACYASREEDATAFQRNLQLRKSASSLSSFCGSRDIVNIHKKSPNLKVQSRASNSAISVKTLQLKFSASVALIRTNVKIKQKILNLTLRKKC